MELAKCRSQGVLSLELFQSVISLTGGPLTGALLAGSIVNRRSVLPKIAGQVVSKGGSQKDGSVDDTGPSEEEPLAGGLVMGGPVT